MALQQWNPEVNHAVLLFFCPFHFQMAMRDSQLHCHHFGKKFNHLLMILTYFPYLSFFLFLGLIPTWIISQLLALTPAVLFIRFAVLSPRGMRALFGSFLLINLGLSEVFIASVTFLEIRLLSVVICCPRASANFSKQFPIWVTSGSWTGGSVISFTFKVSQFWLVVRVMINI